MRRRRLTCGIVTAAMIGGLVAVSPAAAKGAGGVSSVTNDSTTVTGPPGTGASILRYAAIATGSTTSVLAIETQGGAIRRQRTLDGRWSLPAVTLRGDAGGLSADGRTLVVIRPNLGFGDTEFLVLDGRSLRTEDEVALSGQFAFDAISPDGRVIYLIEYPRRGNPIEYRVRAYDVASGELRRGAVIDPDEAGGPMTGEPVARAMSPDGRWAYTLYRGEETFIHALDTVEAGAVCIALSQFEGSNFFALDLVADSGSGALTVLERGDPAVEIDPQTFEIGPADDPGATEAGGGASWLVWALVGGLVLCAGVFARTGRVTRRPLTSRRR
jgi:hypothetical protein